VKWKLNNGRTTEFYINQYRIDWNKKAPSKGSQILKDFFRRNCFHDIWLEEMRIPGCLLRVDFVNLTRNIAFEFDGAQHDEYNRHFHGEKIGWLNSIKRDVKKEKILADNGFQVVRVKTEDLDKLCFAWFEKNFGIIL
jgi:very-short-patch-repair endonuclease